MLGVCREAIPGQRRDDYPGTEAEYVDEQRRLFYVSITRAKKTLVLSRALKVRRGEAERLGLRITTGNKYWGDLKMSPFLHEIIALLPEAVPGTDWVGCV
jgi:superfamily I DNA/RNA helicase